MRILLFVLPDEKNRIRNIRVMDMTRSLRSWFCFLLAAVTVLAGIQMQKKETDSLLSYEGAKFVQYKENWSHSGTTGADGLICPPAHAGTEAYYAEELSGLRPLSLFLGRIRSILPREDARPAGAVLLMVGVLAYLCFFRQRRCLCLCFNAERRRVIIRYIHYQDGQKG